MRRYQIKGPQIIHETIDGEVVIVNLETGNYYCLEDTGQRIWAAVERATAVDDIVAELCASQEGIGDHPGDTVSTFLEELAQEGLIEAVPETEPSPPREPIEAVGPRAPFTVPVLERFQDMQELILLDPVHELQADLRWSHPQTAR